VRGRSRSRNKEQEDNMNTDDEILIALAEEIAEVERRFLSEADGKLLLGFTCEPRFAPLTIVI
jgi:hypothetical protein